MQIASFLRAYRNLAALAGGFILTALGWWWLTSVPKAARPSGFTPASELERIAYAARNARSWRVTTFGTMHGEPFQTDQDVVCPYDSHTVTQTRTKSGALEPSGEIIQTRDTLYAREGLSRWAAQPVTVTDRCARGPMAGPTPLSSVLESLKSTSRMVPGQVIQNKESACRVWNLYSGNSPGPIGSLCVDESTHLPYELQLGSLHVQYSYWNMPIQVIAPEIEMPEAVPQR
ncbi:MAG TPA: hypothetical protein VFA68_14900 [Terriglobales bacterium]|nr:hypothetical protein [Terriglobales bacterium]